MISSYSIRNDPSRYARDINVYKVDLLEGLFFIVNHLFFYRRHFVGTKHGVRLRVYFLDYCLIRTALSVDSSLVAIQSFPDQRHALPLFAILVVQAIAMALYAIFVTFRVMGRNYDAAVLAAGHCGFGLGATPTAIANMQAITERFGPSHLAFLVVPMVGAFFIDIANAIVIKLFLLLPIYG